jgi:hypothetical protein
LSVRESLRLHVLNTIADTAALKKLRPCNTDYDNKPIVLSLRRNAIIAIFARHSTRADRRTILLNVDWIACIATASFRSA